MRAIQCVAFGEPATLTLDVVPKPDLSAGHARVRVEYCGVGFADALILAGKYQIRPPLPFIPGSEVAGVVTEVPPGTAYPLVGARVAGLNLQFTGGLAEEIVSPIDAMTVLPPTITTRMAAAMLVSYATAYHGLMQRGTLRPGELVLVLGAAGGVGLACIEVAHACGATVLGACGSESKVEVALHHGASAAFNYSEKPLRREIMRLTGGRGLDVIVDPVGGDYTEEAFRCLRPGGRLLVVGFSSGKIARIPANLALLKSSSIVGVSLAAQMLHESAAWRANLTALFRLHEQGLLRLELMEIDCFQDYVEAFTALAQRSRVGKIVMRIGS